MASLCRCRIWVIPRRLASVRDVRTWINQPFPDSEPDTPPARVRSTPKPASPDQIGGNSVFILKAAASSDEMRTVVHCEGHGSSGGPAHCGTFLARPRFGNTLVRTAPSVWSQTIRETPGVSTPGFSSGQNLDEVGH